MKARCMNSLVISSPQENLILYGTSPVRVYCGWSGELPEGAVVTGYPCPLCSMVGTLAPVVEAKINLLH